MERGEEKRRGVERKGGGERERKEKEMEKERAKSWSLPPPSARIFVGAHMTRLSRAIIGLPTSYYMLPDTDVRDN